MSQIEVHKKVFHRKMMTHKDQGRVRDVGNHHKKCRMHDIVQRVIQSVYDWYPVTKHTNA